MNSFDSWLISKVSVLSLTSSNLGWIKRFFPDLHDFASQIKFGDEVYQGRGIRKNPDLALRVSIVEALERLVAMEFGLETTNGVAAGFSIEESRRRARFELIERDLFLSHFVTLTPFREMPTILELIPPSVRDYIKKNSDQIRLFKMKDCNIGQGYICLISGGNRWGGIVGLSFGDSTMEELISSALLESFRQYWHFFNHGKILQSISLEEFCDKDKWSFADHLALALNAEYFASFSSIFDDCQNGEMGEICYGEAEFSFRELDFNGDMLNGSNVVVSQCMGKLSQSLYVGKFEERFVSRDGLCRFSGSVSPTVNCLPHPLS